MNKILSTVKGFLPTKVNPMLVIGVLVLLVLVAIFLTTEGFVGVDASGSRVAMDASGTKVAIDGSGNMITLSIADLIRALSSSAERPNTVTKTAVVSTSETLPPPSAFPRTVSSMGLSSEDEKRIASTVAKQVKDSLLAERSTTPVLPASNSAASGMTQQPESDSCAQGMDYSENSPYAPWNSPDYVRKDSIPCWGCTLPQ